ncbi:MobA/MobL family protein [Erythrobacter sp. T5W1-R]|uniref:MobA/MobL family protein n=1 Tax=Erythrobacter sp. T5W1-R TaxID=3101752 RepID=UPI002AFE650F|nr:MobA/MobL family protein [Erythrobacter sp. T5W1-R]MEA1619171.1 MobA/MobL family protein [Erythrobacter sp. T5W1-R]
MLTPEQQFEAARCYAENTFGRQGLPYLVVLHPPSEDGDQRNWHVHILFSFRPMERIAEGEWEIGRYLRTDLDSPEQFARLRYLWSEQLNHACEQAGVPSRFTHLSYVGAGLPYQSQVHNGPGLTAKIRRGEYVARNLENHRIAISNSAKRAIALAKAELLNAASQTRQQVERSMRIALAAQAIRASRPPPFDGWFSLRSPIPDLMAIQPISRPANDNKRPMSLPEILPARREQATADSPGRMQWSLPDRALPTWPNPTISARVDSGWQPDFKSSLPTTLPYFPPQRSDAQAVCKPLGTLPQQLPAASIRKAVKASWKLTPPISSLPSFRAPRNAGSSKPTIVWWTPTALPPLGSSIRPKAMPWKLSGGPVAVPVYKNIRQVTPRFDRPGWAKALPPSLPSALEKTPPPALAELARRVSQSAIFRMSDAIGRIDLKLAPLPDEREPIVTAVSEPPAQTIAATEPINLAEEERRALAFLDRNREKYIHVEKGSDGFIYPGRIYWHGNRLTEAGLRNPIAQRQLQARFDQQEGYVDYIVTKLIGRAFKDTSRETLVGALPPNNLDYIAGMLRSEPLHRQVVEAYYDGGKQRCLLASKAWQDAPSNNQNQRLRLAARAKRLRDSLGFSLPLPQALADKLEQDAKEHDRRLLAAKAAAAAAGSSDTGGSSSSVAPHLSADDPAPSPPRRQQRSVEPESSAGNGELHEELIAEIESTPGLRMTRKQGKLVPAMSQQEEGGSLSANFEHPDVQSALEQERRRQWQFVREVWGVLTTSVTKSDMDGGSAAVIKALPDDLRHKASPWAETPIWGLMLRQLEKSGKRRSEAAVRRWEEARRNEEHNLPAIAANVAARLKRWPIQIAPETGAAIKQDVARHAAQIAAQQNMLGR